MSSHRPPAPPSFIIRAFDVCMYRIYKLIGVTLVARARLAVTLAAGELRRRQSRPRRVRGPAGAT